MSRPAVTVLDPCAPLPQVAACLQKHFEISEMARVTVWLTTASAGQRLREHLSAAGMVLLPQIRVLAWDDSLDGPLPGGLRVASRAEERLAWHTALRQNHVENQLPVVAEPVLAGQAQGIQALANRLTTHGVSAPQLAEAVPAELLQHWRVTAERLAHIWQQVDHRLHDYGMIRDTLQQCYGWQTLAARVSGGMAPAEARTHVVLAPVDAAPGQLALVRALMQTGHGMLVLPVAPDRDPLAARLLQELELVAPEAGTAMPTTVPVLVEADSLMAEVRTVSTVVRHAGAEGHGRVAVVCADDTLRQRIGEQLREDGVTVATAGGVPLRLSTAGQLVQRMLQVLLDLSGSTFQAAAMTSLTALGQLPLVRDGNPALYWPELEEKLWRGVVVRSWRELRLKAEGLTTRRDPALLEQAATLHDLLALDADDTDAPQRHDILTWRTRLEHLLTALAPNWPQAWGASGVRAWWQDWPARPDTAMDAAAFALWAMQDLAGQCLPEPPAAEGHAPVLLWAPRDAVWQDADTLVLCGLNEGSWPARDRDDWLNAAMLARLGLPSPASREALAAHDWQALMQASGRIFITRHRHQQTSETVPSRLWTRLVRQLEQNGTLADSLRTGQAYLDVPAAPAASRTAAPEVTLGVWPPLTEAWPRMWSASWIRAVMDCPYRAVGQRLLHLEAWEPFGALPDKATTGTLVHAWVEAFWQQKRGHDDARLSGGAVLDWPAPWPEAHGPLTPDNRAAAEDHFMQIARFGLRQESAMVQRLWAPRLPRLSAALIDLWLRDAAEGRTPEMLEVWLKEPLPGHDAEDGIFVGAQADRIDRAADGLVVLDFKTGRVPPKKDVMLGRQPQLPLEAWLLGRQRRFADTPVAQAEYWQLRGYGETPVQRQVFSADEMDGFVRDLEEGLPRLVHTMGPAAAFPATPEVDGACKSCALAGVCRRLEVGR